MRMMSCTNGSIVFKKQYSVTGYVTMPNHVHALLYFPEMPNRSTQLLAMQKDFLLMK